MGWVSNGGIYMVLDASYEFAADDLSAALKAVGAIKAAEHFDSMVKQLSVPVPASPQETREVLIKAHWKETMDHHDMLPDEAYGQLLRVLEDHVRQNQPFYERLGD